MAAKCKINHVYFILLSSACVVEREGELTSFTHTYTDVECKLVLIKPMNGRSTKRVRALGCLRSPKWPTE